MTIHVASRRLAPTTLAHRFPGAQIIDVTSRGPQPWVALSPFYPHGGIPVPGQEALTSQSAEGIWQALKVFESEDIDLSKLSITTMRGIKRTVRKHGPVAGHRYGRETGMLLGYREAREKIYLPAYRWVLENPLVALIDQLRTLGDVVLLDYTTNDDLGNLAAPLSHAALVRRWVEGDWPRTTRDVVEMGA